MNKFHEKNKNSKIKLIDIVYEVVDARMPASSRIKDIDDLIKDKPKVIIMTKKDLCDIEKTNKWISYYEEQGYKVFLVDLINDKSLGKLFDLTDSVLSELNEKREEKEIHIVFQDKEIESHFSIKANIVRVAQIENGRYLYGCSFGGRKEEIEEYLWLKFDKAMNSLKFPNDKQMLRKANEYLLNVEVTNG